MDEVRTHNVLPTHILDERTSEATHREMMMTGIKYMLERTEQHKATPRWNLIARYRLRSEVIGMAEVLRTMNRWSLHDAIHGEDDA